MNHLTKTETFYVCEKKQTIFHPLLFIHFPFKQKFLKSKYTDITVNSFSFLEKKNNPQEYIFLCKKNCYIARANTQKHYYQHYQPVFLQHPSVKNKPPAIFSRATQSELHSQIFLSLEKSLHARENL